MKIKSSVFGSESEKELFKTLNTNWSDKLNLYSNLPFVNIIDVSVSNLSDNEKNFLYKTSVDYTLCTKADNPLLSIEFDGLGHGFSKVGEYIQIIQTEDPHRKLKLDLKLRIAKEVGYPFFVVSYDEKVPLGKDIHLTIVDGIIGQVLARKHFNKYIKEKVPEFETECHNIKDSLFCLGEELNSKLYWNPIFGTAWEYELEAHHKGLCKFCFAPIEPGFDWETHLKGLCKSVSVTFLNDSDAIRVGCKVAVETPKGKIYETVWMRNMIGSGFDPLSLAENIAKLIAFKKLLDFS